MSRSTKKGPYIDQRLLKKIKAGQKEPIKTWARSSQIPPEFVGHRFAVHNGRNFVEVFVVEEMVGTGKTTLATAIAEALGRKMVRIPFGGIEEPFYLRGRSRVFPQAQPGQIIKGLRQAKAANPIILLDEIDRIAEEARSSIMGVLVELLDPEQNNAFTDYFIDYPFDLSEAFFITTCNNTTNISQAVLDRLEIISMPSYSDEEKIIIGKNYLLPEAIAEAGLEPQQVVFTPDVWPKIVRPLGYDAGVRTLKRNLEGICRQIAKKVVSGEGERFEITTENVKEYLPMW
jgi:ATP-dependent Lon protease